MSDCVTTDNERVVFQSSDTDLKLKINLESTGDPLDLSSASAIKARFRKADDTILEKTLGSGVTVTSGPGGRLTVALAAADTALMKVGSRQDFQVEITIASKVTTVEFSDVLTVKERLA